MKGKYSIRVRNSRNEYNFELKRNITVLCGDTQPQTVSGIVSEIEGIDFRRNKRM